MITYLLLVFMLFILTLTNSHLLTFYIFMDIMSWLMTWLVILSIFYCLLAYNNVSIKINIMWMILLLMLITCFMVNNLLTFYIFFEMSLIPVLVMILIMGIQPERLSATYYFLLYTSVVSLPMLFLILKNFFSLNFFSQYYYKSSMFLFFILPFFVKLPVFGVHFWLPKAHVEASISGSMVLAGLMLKLGSFGLSRIISIFGPSLFLKMKSSFVFLVVISSVITTFQSDSKKMVAYSSVAHMSFVLMAAFMGLKLMWMAIILSSVSHCWASMGLFASSGLISHGSGSRLVFLMKTKSFWGSFGLILWGLICINFSIPPLPSFFSEILMFLSLCLMSKNTLLLLIMGFLFCYYNIKLYTLISHNKINYSSTSSFFCLEAQTIFGILLMSLPSVFFIVVI